ncbi:MAG: hypothetical protein RBU45_17665 [Myxococcota bacterium]|jgi:hypothetical protein|nr:hypothetical protein [Myxococcota bacterium]
MARELASTPSLLRFLVLPLLGLVITGCGCDDDEIDSYDACERLTSGFTAALTQCQLSEGPASLLCTASCGDGCIENRDVETCAAAMFSLGCGELTLQAVEQIDVCADVLREIAQDDCSSHDDDDDDDDDD